MRTTIVFAGGISASVLAATVAAMFLFRSLTVAPIVLMYAGLHAIALGLPIAVLLHRLRRIHWWTGLLGGFLCGALPTALWSWPLRFPELQGNSSQWDGERIVETMVDGVPTTYGWLVYIQEFSFYGAFGAVGGLAFWLVWSRANAP